MSHIETGRSFPKADLIEKFANILNVEYNTFFNIKHMKSREEIISEIKLLLDNTDDKKLGLIYRLIMDILF